MQALSVESWQMLVGGILERVEIVRNHDFAGNYEGLEFFAVILGGESVKEVEGN